MRQAGARGIGDATALLPSELAFLLERGVPEARLRRAAAEAVRVGVSPDMALIRNGWLSEAAYYEALADALDLPFLTDGFRVRPGTRFPEAVLTGLAPLVATPDGPAYIYAPAGDDVARLAELRTRLSGFAITTPTALRQAVFAERGRTIAALAADGLPVRTPHLSYYGGVTPGQATLWGCLSAALGALVVHDPEATWQAVTLVLAGLFLAATVPRLAAPLESIAPEPSGPARRRPEADLPVYTVVVALYREAAVLPRLLGALEALDYPAPKLDIKLVVEEEDGQTRAALAARALPPHVEVVVVPPGEPRTKPRALNVALAIARGEYLVIFDAEDVPCPGQLRLAVEVFASSEPEVACLQARLAIDNTADSWLTRFFTIEYASLFDVINPALIRFDLPVTLGGTSNHMRTAVLRRVGGWDAWNVTEDADLGLRLSRAGYRVADLPSTTWEEAPRRLRPWLRQRTRWMKGFLQVAIVHGRRPAEGLRQLGPLRFAGAGFVTLGVVASAFVFPFFLAYSGYRIGTGEWLEAAGPGDVAANALGATLFVAGLLSLVLPPAVALARRRWWRLMPLVPLMPFYFLLVSVAAWRGAFELLTHPVRWNKTEHGLASTSRMALAAAAASDRGDE